MSTEFRTPNDLWNEVSAQLGYDLELGIRTWLEKTGYVSAVLTADLQMPALGHLLQAAREAQLMIDSVTEERKSSSTGIGQGIATPERYISTYPDSLAVEEEGEQRDLLGILIAKRIEKSKEVVQFREEFLPDGLLDSREVSDWIYQNAPAESPRYMVYRALGFVFSADERQYVVKSADMYYHDLFGSVLNELSPEDRLEQVGGNETSLGQLVSLAMAISEQTGWVYSETVWFLLTGERPALPVVRAVPVKIFSDSGPRILMEVSMEAAPEDVRTAYKLQRDRVYPRKRSKPLDDKTVAFARFVLEQDGVAPDRPEDWQSIVTSWNDLPEVRDRSWEIESDERRRISNTYKRAIDAIESFSGGFDQEAEQRLRRIAEAKAAMEAEYLRIYGDPSQDTYARYPEDRYDHDGIRF